MGRGGIPERDGAIVTQDHVITVGCRSSHTRIAIDLVIARAAQEQVIAFVALDRVVAAGGKVGRSHERDHAVSERDLGKVANDHVVAGVPRERLWTLSSVVPAAQDNVVIFVAADRVVSALIGLRRLLDCDPIHQVRSTAMAQVVRFSRST